MLSRADTAGTISEKMQKCVSRGEDSVDVSGRRRGMDDTPLSSALVFVQLLIW